MKTLLTMPRQLLLAGATGLLSTSHDEIMTLAWLMVKDGELNTRPDYLAESLGCSRRDFYCQYGRYLQRAKSNALHYLGAEAQTPAKWRDYGADDEGGRQVESCDFNYDEVEKNLAENCTSVF